MLTGNYYWRLKPAETVALMCMTEESMTWRIPASRTWLAYVEWRASIIVLTWPDSCDIETLLADIQWPHRRKRWQLENDWWWRVVTRPFIPVWRYHNYIAAIFTYCYWHCDDDIRWLLCYFNCCVGSDYCDLPVKNIPPFIDLLRWYPTVTGIVAPIGRAIHIHYLNDVWPRYYLLTMLAIVIDRWWLFCVFIDDIFWVGYYTDLTTLPEELLFIVIPVFGDWLLLTYLVLQYCCILIVIDYYWSDQYCVAIPPRLFNDSILDIDYIVDRYYYTADYLRRR